MRFVFDSSIQCTCMAIKVTYDCACMNIQVGERQKRRKVSQMKAYISSTLEPCLTSYGLAPTSVTASSTDGCLVTIPIADSPTPSTSTSSVNRPLADTAGTTTACTLYLLDRFAVSDQFYHELAQVFNFHSAFLYVC